MSGKDLKNPFLQNKLNLSLDSSLLSYGGDSFSMYKMLKKNSRLSQSSVIESQKSMEEKILWKYEKEFYEVDEQGHSLAQQSITQEILKQKPSTDDFWSKVKALSSRRNSNPFSKITAKDEIQTASHFTSSTYLDRSRATTMAESKKTDRKNKCKEAMKLRHFIENKKAPENQQKTTTQKFSLLKMYKEKQAEDSQTLPLYPKGIRKRETFFQHPQSIYVDGLQYFRVPLE